MFATGSARPVGLVSTEPPTSPETIGRAPSNFDPPVPLVPLEELVGLKKAASEAPAASDAPVAPMASPGGRRVVLKLVGGEELELGAYDDQEAALARAQELIALVNDAEAAGEWPEVEGRLLRPAAIVSIDLLVES